MTTITFKPGATGPFAMAFTDGDGNALAWDAVQLRIHAGASCEVIAGSVAGGRWQFDLSALALPPRLYPVSVYFDEGDGFRQLLDGPDLLFNITGGC
ncbi:hypothetical protein [Paracoccus sp. ME4]|uniref:hypothetical protein n=1 Tax=Paracoccus sp. ME4 TaxID=3138066 RepID=UPI00398B1366